MQKKSIVLKPQFTLKKYLIENKISKLIICLTF